MFVLDRMEAVIDFVRSGIEVDQLKDSFSPSANQSRWGRPNSTGEMKRDS